MKLREFAVKYKERFNLFGNLAEFCSAIWQVFVRQFGKKLL